jgi:RND superfamily putative drug exporter
VLVPAITSLLGERIWYAPAWLKRVHRRFGLSEATVTAEPDTQYSRLARADNG